MDLSKYATLFLAESREHLKACNSSLLEWEKEPAGVEPVDRLFRAIHTIKGMAATMGYSAVAQLSHGIESLLDGLPKGRLQGSSVVFQLLFRAIDTLGKSVEAAAAGAEEPPDVALLAELEREANPAADGSAAAPEAPTPARRISDAPRSRPIQVTIRPGAVMRGARAALVLRRAETLGAVNTVRPALAELEGDDFDGRFSFRLQTRSSDSEITAALRAVGDVETIEIVEPVAAGADSQPGANRQIRVDLRRLDPAERRHLEPLGVARSGLHDVSRDADCNSEERAKKPGHAGEARRQVTHAARHHAPAYFPWPPKTQRRSAAARDGRRRRQHGPSTTEVSLEFL